ncbi:MAG: class I SAM-dependent methyltransferase [Pedosphaera sp.]|nr:class I SAM-dependent methyltransferase [Pedosphaera sp.]
MIVTWSQGRADNNMPENLLVDLADRVRRHPWWRARAKLALAMLQRNGFTPPSEILDAGCGWGTNLDALERAGYRVCGLDISRRMLERLDRPDRTLIEADLTQPLPSQVQPADGLLALDVIEHLDDDRAAVTRLAQLVKPGGLVVVSVPALPELFSRFDEVQGHRRRYVPETLHAAFAGSGLNIVSICWWGAWMVPVLRRTRRAGGDAKSQNRTYADYLRLPPWPAPWLMRVAYAWEHGRALDGKLKTGTSLFALARKSV